MDTSKIKVQEGTSPGVLGQILEMQLNQAVRLYANNLTTEELNKSAGAVEQVQEVVANMDPQRMRGLMVLAVVDNSTEQDEALGRMDVQLIISCVAAPAVAHGLLELAEERLKEARRADSGDTCQCPSCVARRAMENDPSIREQLEALRREAGMPAKTDSVVKQ